MTIVYILLGLIGLSIVVTVHEAGHFFAAKAVGVTVEVFSIGMGPKIFGFKPKNSTTEYRLSLFPIGGFCKMKGEEAFRDAIDKKLPEIELIEGSFFAAATWKRIIISVAGPLANLLFSFIVITCIWFFGFSVESFGNKIILVSDIERTKQTIALAVNPESAQTEITSYPSDIALLKSGDKIVAVNGKATDYYVQLQEAIVTKPNEKLNLSVLRGTETLELTVSPKLNPDTGAGLIGIYAFIEPVLEGVKEDSIAMQKGFAKGDILLSINGFPVQNAVDISSILSQSLSKADFVVRRGETDLTINVIGSKDLDTIAQGFEWKTYSYVEKSKPGEILLTGLKETYNTVMLSFKSLGLLFSGVNLSKAISGPIGITSMTGEVAVTSFSAGIGKGLSTTFNFLSFISIALFIMNLLPIPVLDGGQVVLALIESIKRKPLKPIFIARYQTVGAVLVLALFVFSTFNDVAKFFIQ